MAERKYILFCFKTVQPVLSGIQQNFQLKDYVEFFAALC